MSLKPHQLRDEDVAAQKLLEFCQYVTALLKRQMDAFQVESVATITKQELAETNDWSVVVGQNAAGDHIITVRRPGVHETNASA